MSRSKVTYSKDTRRDAEKNNLPLWTVDVDRRHVKTGDRFGVRMTMQGSSLSEGLKVRRTMLELCGVSQEEIDRILGKEEEQKVGEILSANDEILQAMGDLAKEQEG